MDKVLGIFDTLLTPLSWILKVMLYLQWLKTLPPQLSTWLMDVPYSSMEDELMIGQDQKQDGNYFIIFRTKL